MDEYKTKHKHEWHIVWIGLMMYIGFERILCVLYASRWSEHEFLICYLIICYLSYYILTMNSFYCFYNNYPAWMCLGVILKLWCNFTYNSFTNSKFMRDVKKWNEMIMEQTYELNELKVTCDVWTGCHSAFFTVSKKWIFPINYIFQWLPSI